MERRWLSEEEIDRAITFRQIGRRMKEARAEVGLSQEKVAQRADISRETYRKAENGETESDVITIYRIAEALERSIFELMPEYPREIEPTPTKATASGDETILFSHSPSGLHLRDRMQNVKDAYASVTACAIPIG